MKQLIKYITDLFLSLGKNKNVAERKVTIAVETKEAVVELNRAVAEMKQPKEVEINSKYIWLFDPGHGGMRDGKYVTSGKRSPVWDDGSQYFEGVGNREIVKKLVKRLRVKGIDARDIVDSENDIRLSTRVKRANAIYHENGGNVIYVSIHSDGWKKESAHGYSVYTSPKQTKSDIIAEIFIENMEKEFPLMKLRADTTDGDRDKEANLAVCRDTYGPAILIENFFMTNEKNCREILMTEKGQNRIVKCHIASVLEIEKNGII